MKNFSRKASLAHSKRFFRRFTAPGKKLQLNTGNVGANGLKRKFFNEKFTDKFALIISIPLKALFCDLLFANDMALLCFAICLFLTARANIV
ncbi:hypothetical protein [[Erwinia] mediterraneensis]|uniref:hypothetical protein n=1 Tax=[Erwinia] mediterraneensis TaxID=2161819 RepID=UPI00102F969E|nr:hypothetical protein [[Erwinia] mediterraneensis]